MYPMKPRNATARTSLVLTAVLRVLIVCAVGAGCSTGRAADAGGAEPPTDPHDARWWLAHAEHNLIAVKDTKVRDSLTQRMIVALGDQGDWANARTYAAQLSERQRAVGYLLLVRAAARRGDARTAEDFAMEIPDGAYRERAWKTMALMLVAAGDLDRPRRILDRLGTATNKDAVLAAIAKAQAALRGNTQEALKTLDGVASQEVREAAAREIKALVANPPGHSPAPPVVFSNPLSAQLDLTLMLVGKGAWGDPLAEANALREAGRIPEAIKALEQLETAVHKMDYGCERATAMVCLALAEWQTGRLDMARTLLREVRKDMQNATQPAVNIYLGRLARPALVTSLVMVGETRDAMSLAEADVAEGTAGMNALSSVAIALAACGRWSELHAWVASLPKPEYRAYVCLGACEWQAYVERQSVAASQPRGK
jgi:tetratricopeptide (TPR) repeat protein